MKWERRELPLWLFAVTLLAMFFAVACSRQAPTESEGARPVKTMVVSATAEPTVRVFPGRVDSERKADLSFQVSGLIVRLPVEEGQKIAKGSLIAQIRPDEFRARLETAQGQLDQARATLAALHLGERPEEQLGREAQLRAADARLANAKTEYERLGRLVNSRAISRSEYELAATAYRVAQEDRAAAVQRVQQGTVARKEDIDAQAATVRGLEGRVADAKLQLEDTTLRAPFDGVVAQRFVEQGQSITVNTPVVRLQSVDAIDIVADVPESAMASIRSAVIKRMVAETSGAPGRSYPVRIREVAQVADPTTQTFQVRFGMQPPPGAVILPGMTATVTVSSGRPGSARNRILVPVSAVSKQDSGTQVVWVLGPDQTVHSRPVMLGAPSGDDIEITGGVKPGDRIVVAGAPFMREGMAVRDLGFALGGG